MLEFQSNLLRLEGLEHAASRVGTIARHRRAVGDREMPTDHGPELEALRKRLADAKEFL